MQNNHISFYSLMFIICLSTACTSTTSLFQKPNSETSIQALPHAHAHNDYLHDSPLQEALQHGFTSVEADVLYQKEKLYVGHTKLALLKTNTPILEDLYLKPLYQYYQKNKQEIYPNYEGQFYLWIDIKYASATVYPLLKKALLPYKKMLTYYENGELHQGKVTVVLSGDRPFDLVLKDDLQLMTLDGRLGDLDKNYSSELMPFISEHWRRVFKLDKHKQLSKVEFLKLKTFVQQCHAEGKKTRFWATPESERLWQQLLEAEVDLINTDELGHLRAFFIK